MLPNCIMVSTRKIRGLIPVFCVPLVVFAGCSSDRSLVRRDAAGSPAVGGNADGAGGQVGVDPGRDSGAAGNVQACPRPDAPSFITSEGQNVLLESCGRGSCPFRTGGAGPPASGGTSGGGGTAAVGGMGGDASTNAVSCAATNIAPTDPDALRIYKVVEPQLDDDLLAFMMPFACGAIPLYRGTFSAQDSHGGTVGLAPGGGGKAVAFLDSPLPHDAISMCSGTTLVRRLSIVADGWAQFYQGNDADVTSYATLIGRPFTPISGVEGQCVGCLPDFRLGAPATIDLATTTFSASACDVGNPRSVVQAGGHLEATSAFTADEIQAISQPNAITSNETGFALQGTDEVATKGGYATEKRPIGCYQDCTVRTKYHVDWYFSRQNPRSFGLRNFRVEPSTSSCCASYVPNPCI